MRFGERGILTQSLADVRLADCVRRMVLLYKSVGSTQLGAFEKADLIPLVDLTAERSAFLVSFLLSLFLLPHPLMVSRVTQMLVLTNTPKGYSPLYENGHDIAPFFFWKTYRFGRSIAPFTIPHLSRLEPQTAIARGERQRSYRRPAACSGRPLKALVSTLNLVETKRSPQIFALLLQIR